MTKSYGVRKLYIMLWVDRLQPKSTKKSQVKITQLKKGGQTNET